MPKRSSSNDLSAALKRKAQGVDKPLDLDSQATPVKRSPRPPSRVGGIMVSAWLPIEARSSLRTIQAHHPKKKIQELVIEALNDLFAKYNVPQTAALGREAED